MKTIVRLVVILFVVCIFFSDLSYGQVLAGTDDLGRTLVQKQCGRKSPIKQTGSDVLFSLA